MGRLKTMEPTKTAAKPTSYMVEVIADNSGKWCSNGLRFADEQTAKDYGQDLFMRWTAVRQWRVAPSDEPVNR